MAFEQIKKGELVELLVNDDCQMIRQSIENNDTDFMVSLLREGHTGYSHMEREELLEDALQRELIELEEE